MINKKMKGPSEAKRYNKVQSGTTILVSQPKSHSWRQRVQQSGMFLVTHCMVVECSNTMDLFIDTVAVELSTNCCPVGTLNYFALLLSTALNYFAGITLGTLSH